MPQPDSLPSLKSFGFAQRHVETQVYPEIVPKRKLAKQQRPSFSNSGKIRKQRLKTMRVAKKFLFLPTFYKEKCYKIRISSLISPKLLFLPVRFGVYKEFYLPLARAFLNFGVGSVISTLG